MAAARGMENGYRGSMGEPISLLWPPGTRPAQHKGRLSLEAMADLDLERVTLALSGGESHREGFVRSVLAALCPDPAVIAYRAAIFTDLLEDEGLHARLQRALPALTALAQASGPLSEGWVVHQVVQRLNEL